MQTQRLAAAVPIPTRTRPPADISRPSPDDQRHGVPVDISGCQDGDFGRRGEGSCRTADSGVAGAMGVLAVIHSVDNPVDRLPHVLDNRYRSQDASAADREMCGNRVRKDVDSPGGCPQFVHSGTMSQGPHGGPDAPSRYGDLPGALCYSRPCIGRRTAGEAHVPTQEAPAAAGTRFSGPDAYARGSARPPAACAKGQAPAGGLKRTATPLGRLRRAEEFRRAYRDGRRITGAVGTVYAVDNCGGATRVGFRIGRRFGSAVQRNRARRRLREALRGVEAQLTPGVDVVVVPRTAVLSLGFVQVRRELVDALRAVGALRSDAG